jgi:gamma-glutamyltranspeptidase / glutathione hydrolase
MRLASLAAVIAAICFAQSRPPERGYARSMTISPRGIVATSQVLASQAGAMILAEGGSAVDAAIAANAVLGLTEPMMDGIGGDLFVLHRDAKTGAITGLNASGPAPRAMTIEALKAKGHYSMPATGIHSVSVPGCVRGWAAIHKRFGKLPWRELFAAAIALAENGFPVHEFSAGYWESATARRFPETLRVHYPGGKAVPEGAIFRNPDLARAYRLIAAKGADVFYKGEIAQAILATSKKEGGLLSAEDLASYEPEWVTPISTDYRGWRVTELPPNGQGLAALSMLNMLEGFTPAPPGSTLEFHRKIEAMKLAYADLKYVADPRSVRIPTQELLSKPYAQARARLIDPEKANCYVTPGAPKPSSDTTYLSVVDKDGNSVAWIQSIAFLWGSGITVDGMGFVLHNRANSFQFDTSHPNTLAPGKRPFHTIIPGMLEKDEKHIAFGIMGGANQPLAHAQFVSNIVDHAMNLQAALESPRFTKLQATGCDVMIENRAGAEALEGLTKLGHQLTIYGAYSGGMGRGTAVMHDAKTKINFAAADPRGDGAAIPEP